MDWHTRNAAYADSYEHEHASHGLYPVEGQNPIEHDPYHTGGHHQSAGYSVPKPKTPLWLLVASSTAFVLVVVAATAGSLAVTGNLGGDDAPKGAAAGGLAGRGGSGGGGATQDPGASGATSSPTNGPAGGPTNNPVSGNGTNGTGTNGTATNNTTVDPTGSNGTTLDPTAPSQTGQATNVPPGSNNPSNGPSNGPTSAATNQPGAPNPTNVPPAPPTPVPATPSPPTKDPSIKPLPFIPKGALAFAKNGSTVVARAYDGGAWEPVPNSNLIPAPVQCNGVDCFMRDYDFEIENITMPADLATSTGEQDAARLLSQGTFGASLDEIKRVASAYANNPSGWVVDQIAKPATFAREYYRKRVNPRLLRSSKIPTTYKYKLPETEPCMLNTRWHEYAFETRDDEQVVEVSDDAAAGMFVLKINGTIRTMTTNFGGQDYPGSRALPASFKITSVRDGIGRSVRFTGLSSYPNPVINFTSAAAATLGASLQVMAENAAAWSDIVGGLPGSNILTWRGAQCTVVEDAAGNAFIRFGANRYLRFDKRVRLWTNSLDQPSKADGGPNPGECPITPRRRENRDHCVVRTTCGGGTTIHHGTEVPLNDATLRVWNTDSNDKRLVYYMRGLRLEHDYAISFCSSVFSRWLKKDTCTETTFRSQGTKDAIVAALATSPDLNPIIRDVSVTAAGCDSDDPKTIGAFVRAGGSCWQHIHPDEYSVRDATQWAVDHDGNAAAMAFGGPNPISKFADIMGMNMLYYPSSHAMHRWSNRRVNLPYIGRFGDAVDFADLDSKLQTTRMAAHVNVTIEVATGGVTTCGSFGEVANDPTLGYHYVWYQGTGEQRHTEFKFGEYDQHKRVLTNIALKGDDQLRQRVAWVLSNFFVIGNGDRYYSEAALKWYDIFIRHGFGNFQDILNDVTFNSRMSRWLTYHGSRSTEARNGAGLPDENYAREIMQLFSIGLWKLNDDGSKVLDGQGLPIQTYSADDIMDFARIFTGMYASVTRTNLLDRIQGTASVYVDDVSVSTGNHDKVPKAKLNGGHLGDHYPICDDLPRPWLHKGARFEYTGESSFEGGHLDDAASSPHHNQRTRFTPPHDGSSGLYNALCAPPSLGAKCTFPMVVKLPSTLKCSGDQECNATRVVVVAVYDPVLNATRFYRFIEPPCVRLTFFKDGMQLRSRSDTYRTCTAPTMRRGYPSCCDPKALTTKKFVKCRFANEMYSYPEAQARCEAQNMTTCSFVRPEWSATCGNTSYVWTNKPCELQIQVYNEKRIAIYDPTNRRDRLKYNSYSFFRALWNGDRAPAPTADGKCPTDAPCRPIATGKAFSCICNISVKETTPFQSIISMSGASVDSVVNALFVGAPAPHLFDSGVYTECTSSPCKALASSDVKVWLHADDNEFLLSQRTIVEVPPFRRGDAPRYLFNRLSMVHVGAYSFRNMPNFIPNTGYMYVSGGTFVETTKWFDRKIEQEVEALHKHLAEHQNTAVFLATHMIKHMVTSNPSPRYVAACAKAFRNGESAGVTFSGKYGDMAALVHAILVDHEARSMTLLADSRAGMVHDPIVKVMSVMRGMEYKSRFDRELSMRFHNAGMNFLAAPTVFGFFDPFYQPAGRLAQHGLFAPQAELIDSPNMVGLLNGLHSLVDSGLTACNNGIGEMMDGVGCSSNLDLNRQRADGVLNMKPSSNDTVTVLRELGLVLCGGRLTESSITWKTLATEYETVLAGGDEDAAFRHVTKLVLSSPEFHTTAAYPPSSTPRPPPPPPKSQNRTMKSIIFVNLLGGADSISFLLPFDGCKDGNGNAFDLYEHYKDVRTLSTHDKAFLRAIDARSSNQKCDRFAMHTSMSGLADLYDSGELSWFANIGALVEPVSNVTYYKRETKKPRFLYSHNFQQGALQKADGLHSTSDTYGVVGKATDELSARSSNPFEVWLTDITYSSRILSGKQNRRLKLGSSVNTLKQRATLQPPLENMTANATNPMLSNHFMGEMMESVKAATSLETLLNTVPEPAKWGDNKRFALDCHKAAHALRAAAHTGKERVGMVLSNGGWDTHTTSDLASRFKTISEGVSGLVAQLKADGRWDDTVIILGSEFGRTGTSNGAGTDHGWGGNHFILGGAVKGGRIFGEYPHELRKGPWVIGSRSNWIPKLPWEGMWKGVLEWYGLTNDEINKVLIHLKNFPADRVFDQHDLFN